MTSALDNSDSASGGSIQDIASLAKALAEKERLIADLQKRIEELGQFNRMVTHDLRSPLHTIRGFSEVMYQDLSKGQTANLISDLQRVIDAAKQLHDLLDGIQAKSNRFPT